MLEKLNLRDFKKSPSFQREFAFKGEMYIQAIKRSLVDVKDTYFKSLAIRCVYKIIGCKRNNLVSLCKSIKFTLKSNS